MAESLVITTQSKEGIYQEVAEQLRHIIDSKADVVANMANCAAVLRQAFGFFWVGFYRVIGEELVLGPFQGDLACTRIRYNRGVCGTAWAEKRTLIVPNVEDFSGHIACSSLSKSEIVVPLFDQDKVIAVLDIDSDRLNAFDEIDQRWLEEIVKLI